MLSQIGVVLDLANSQVVPHFRAHMAVAKVSIAEKAPAYLASARQRSVPCRVAFSHPLADEARQHRLPGCPSSVARLRLSMLAGYISGTSKTPLTCVGADDAIPSRLVFWSEF